MKLKESCAIMSTQVTYEIDQISLLFCFYVFNRYLKEKIMLKEI